MSKDANVFDSKAFDGGITTNPSAETVFQLLLPVIEKLGSELHTSNPGIIWIRIIFLTYSSCFFVVHHNPKLSYMVWSLPQSLRRRRFNSYRIF